MLRQGALEENLRGGGAEQHPAEERGHDDHPPRGGPPGLDFDDGGRWLKARESHASSLRNEAATGRQRALACPLAGAKV
jgi:hypothetical protein